MENGLKQKLLKLKVLSNMHRFFESKGARLFLVGGYIRDALLGRDTKDLDFTFKGDVITLARQYAKKIKGAFVLLDEKNATARVIYKETGLKPLVQGKGTGLPPNKNGSLPANLAGRGSSKSPPKSPHPRCNIGASDLVHKKDKNTEWWFDFTGMAGRGIAEDLSRRDFTFNAMAVNLQEFFKTGKMEIIDPFNGMKDLQKCIVRMVNEKSFRDDPLRLLRAFRFSAALDFCIDGKTARAIASYARLIRNASGERIREEIFAIFKTGDSCRSIKDMDRAGLLGWIFPGISKIKNEKGLWKHSVRTLWCLEQILGNKIASGIQPGQKKGSVSHFNETVCDPRTRIELLKFACLFHDAGKPRTKKIKGDRFSFYGHEHTGAKIMEKLCLRLRLSNRETRILENIVRFHMRAHYLANLKEVSERAVSKLIRDCGDELIELLFFTLADFLATPRELKKLDARKYRKTIKKIFGRYVAAKKISRLPRLVNGYDIMKEFSLQQGPVIGRLLDEIELARSENKIKTRQEALGFAELLLKGKLCRMK